MSIPKLVIDKDIAREGTGLESLFGLDEDVVSAKQVADFLDLHKDVQNIEVEVATDGGSTSEAKQMFDRLKNSGKHVKTIGYKVNSSGVVVFLAGNERLISRNADFRVHPVWIDPTGLPMKLESEDLIKFGEELKEEETRLINIYCSVIGEDKRDEVTNLMKQDTNIKPEDAVRLGFATGILEDSKEVSTSNKSISFSNGMAELILNKVKSNNSEMSAIENTIENKLKPFSDVLNKISEKLGIKNETGEPTPEPKNEGEPTPEFHNASVELSEGGSVYFDGELAEGVAVFTDEAMETPAPDGEHALADGRTITVSEGMVESVAPASSESEESEEEEMENKEVEELKNEVNELKDTVQTQTESINKIAESLNKLSPALEAMNSIVPGDTGGESTPVNSKRRSSGTVAMTNLEKKRLNQKK